MLTFIVKAAILASLLGTPVIASLGKPVLFADGLSPHVDSVFWTYLTPTQSTSTQWDWGLIPQRCFDEANSNNVSPYDIEVFDVTYTDCGIPFTFCRHHDASLTQIDMIDLFGRLPVHEREWIQHVMAVPGGGSAYESSAVVVCEFFKGGLRPILLLSRTTLADFEISRKVFQGPVGVPSVFQHEVGHAVDAYSTGSQSSTTSTFENAIQADTCVPDDYSNSNEVEDYTQVSVLSLYEIVNPGGLDPIGNWRCLVNQKNAVDGFQRVDMVPGGTCDRRWANSASVSMGPAAGKNKRATVAPNVTRNLEIGAPKVFTIPSQHRSATHSYNNLVFNETERAAAASRQAGWEKKAQRSERLARVA